MRILIKTITFPNLKSRLKLTMMATTTICSSSTEMKMTSCRKKKRKGRSSWMQSAINTLTKNLKSSPIVLFQSFQLLKRQRLPLLWKPQ